MRSKLFTLIALFGSIFLAKAQEEQDRTQRQPAPVTQAQVEKDASIAQEQRKKHEEGKKAVKEDKIKVEDKRTKSDATNTSSTKKTSTQPGKQR